MANDKVETGHEGIVGIFEQLVKGTTYKDFVAMAQTLVDRVKCAELFRGITDSGTLLYADSLLGRDELSRMTKNEETIGRVYSEMATLSTPVQVVEKLQLLGSANPGISRDIESFLQRACL